MSTSKVNSASTVAEKKAGKQFCRFKNFFNLCSTNVFNESIHAKIFSNYKKAAYGCKSRDFSTFVECVGSDRLLFIYSNTF